MNGSMVDFVVVAFESAGWDVTSIVRLLLLYATWTLDILIIQVSSFPKDEPILVLADAAAIKVSSNPRIFLLLT